MHRSGGRAGSCWIRGCALARIQRRLRVEFSTQEEFLREYNINLANGGIFVATLDAFELNECVLVELVLNFRNESVELEGEVVHRIAPALSEAGAKPGVAVQLSTPASLLRTTLEPIAGRRASGNEKKTGVGKRGAARSDARAPVRLRCEDGTVLEGRTRNISDSGMLVAFQGEPLPVGQRVEASLVHPKTGEEIEVGGTVVRHVKAADGSVMALGIKFQDRVEADAEFTNFVGKVRASEHSKRLGGISGSISELGIHSLLHMFATYSPQGSLHLARGEEEGLLVFDGGLVRGARVGNLRDAPALGALLAWSEGSFEFLARADETDFGALDLPIDEAIHDALVTHSGSDAADEVPSHTLESRLSVPAAVDAESLDKTEQAIVDLARVGMSVAKMIEIIPEPDHELHRSLQGLMERGVIALGD